MRILPLLLLALTLPAAARDTQTLATGWRYLIDVDDLGEKEHWFRPGVDTSPWTPVAVPGPWDNYNEATRGYEGVGWYALTLPPSLARPAAIQFLRFGRVMYHTRVWLNGESLGENIGGYLPFEFDVTRKLRATAPNTLILRVDNRPRLEWLPAARNIEWVQYGGILEPVTLVTLDTAYIDDVTLRTTSTTIDCTVILHSRRPAPEPAVVQLTIPELHATARASVQIQPGANTVRLRIEAPHAKHWSPESPTLYTAQVVLSTNHQPTDHLATRFGIRTLEARGRQILLNGRPIHIQGVNRYSELARYGPCPPRDLVLADLRRMKAAGINTIRVHFPQPPELIDLYDELGFLLSEEVPINWWGNGFSGAGREVQSDAILQFAVPFLEQMIRRDKNHPSVAIWSMCNESKTDNEIGIRVMRTLLRRARELDPTRLRTFIINNRDTAPHRAFEDADIVAFNVYVGGYQGKPANHIEEVRQLIARAAAEHIRKQLAAWPGKPMIVAEYGTPGIAGMHGDVTNTEEYQAALVEQVGRVIQSTPELAGGILWSWADYYHRPNYIKYAPFGPYGVLTVDRRPKRAYTTLLQLYGGHALEP